MNDDEVKKAVREGYAKVAKQDTSCSCCGGSAPNISREIGYTEQEIEAVPEGANLGLGCGNPVAIASLKTGETVLDLGSGGGFDCFLAARQVGEAGRVIGIDMTPEMLERARENARNGGYKNVEFRLGEIERLPVADGSVDVIISNCVINLVPDKRRVFAEAFRVLKGGGRLMISDIVLLKPLPDSVMKSIEAYVGCLAGATMRDEYLAAIRAAGFQQVKVVEETSFPIECMANDPTARAVMDNLKLPLEEMAEIGHSAVSVRVYAVRPG